MRLVEEDWFLRSCEIIRCNVKPQRKEHAWCWRMDFVLSSNA